VKFLLDTCIVSELWTPKPESRVVEWLEQADEGDLALSVLTLGEIQKGISRLPSGKKAQQLALVFSELKKRFNERLLPVSAPIAERWGRLSSKAAREGQTLHPIDGLIAATAAEHELSIVTRNVDDFRAVGVALVNPWSG